MTQMEALELALRMATAAPDQKRSEQATLLANQLAARMTQEEVDTVKGELEFEALSNGLSLGSFAKWYGDLYPTCAITGRNH
jgi:hypothetical protein